MRYDRYAVLDVETTSGDPRIGEVMEVAVVALDGPIERVRWESLVRPSGKIPPFIRRLTGITDGMVASAPRFHEVVRTLETLTQDRIVVAHNVRFDMTALEHEFARTGLVFDRDTVCTERLARRLLPDLEHYNLGALCRYLGIPFAAAHRAGADAEATARLFTRLLDEFGSASVHEQLVSWPRAFHAQ
ncbi:MAG: 3'-5' exonuclease [Flavobacteriales bacterium]